MSTHKDSSWSKRIVSLSLSTTLVLGSSLGAFAQDDLPHDLPMEIIFAEDGDVVVDTPIHGAIDRVAAREIAEATLPLPQGFSLESSHYQSPSRWEPDGSWRLHYVKKSGNEWKGSVTYSINAMTGELTGFQLYDEEAQAPTFPPAISYEEAQRIAQDLLDTISPEKSKLAILNPYYQMQEPIIDGKTNYQIVFIRTHNGIPFPSQTLTVELTTEGKLVNYHSNWDDKLTIPQATNTLTTEEAIERFKQAGKSQFDLHYVFPWGVPNHQGYIAYRWSELGVQFIDAATGDSLNRVLLHTRANNGNLFKPVSTVALPPSISGDGELSEKEALAYVKEKLEIDDSNLKLESASFSSDEHRSVWYFHFQGTNPSSPRFVSVTVDAKTGSIINYYNEDYSQQMKPEVDASGEQWSRDEVIELALEKIKYFIPEYAHEIYYADDQVLEEYGNSTVRLTLHHVLNGITTSSYAVTININKWNGDVYYFGSNIVQGRQYPDATNLLIQEEALDKYLETYQPVLQYQSYQDYDKQETRVRLVYQLIPPQTQDSIFLDASTGSWHSERTGEVVNLHRISPTDIEKHWARDPLMIMYGYGAIDTDQDGKIQPNQTIKRGEMIKMLIIAMNQGHFRPMYGVERQSTYADVAHSSSYFQYVEAAVDLNLLDQHAAEFNPEETLTREELAVLIVKALGFDRLAAHHDLFQLTVSDKDQITNRGHVAIANHLGILTAQQDAFLPHQEVTRAVAATAFYRFLQQRQHVSTGPTRPVHPHY